MRVRKSNRQLQRHVFIYLFLFFFLCELNVLWAGGTSEHHPIPNQQIKAFMCFTIWMLAPIIFTIAGIGVHLYTKVAFPRWIANIAFALKENRWKSLFLGLANVPFLALLVVILAQPAPLMALVLLLMLVLLLLLGLIGKAENLSGKISSAIGGQNNPIISIFATWPILSILIIIPLVGWIIFIYMLVSGTGGVILSLFRFRRDIPTSVPVPAEK